jgi:glucose-1-phosphate thymidylyltransferase
LDSSRIFLVDDGTMSNDTRLGAIRDMELAIREGSIDDDLLVIAGDNLFDLDLTAFLKFAKGRSDGVSVALYDVGSLEAAKKFGVVHIDAKGLVTDFEEKPQAPKSTLISTGIYFFPRQKLNNLREYVNLEGAKLDAPGYYIRWLSANDKVYGFPFSEKWYDIGDLESYKRADEEYTKKGE